MADVVGRAELEAIVSFNVSQVQRSVDQISQRLDKSLGDVAQQVGGKIQGNLSKAFSAVGKAADAALGTVSAVARVAGVALGALAAQALHAGIGFNKLQQQVRGALTAILGGQTGIEDTTQRTQAATKATNELLAAVNALNDESPFSRQSFLQLTQTLAGFGVEASKIPGVLDAIQQSVAATGGGEAELLGLGQAFARIASSGKITGDIIQTFASRGIDLLEVLAREANRAGSAISRFAGKSGAEIRDAISEGALGATESIQALTSALTKDFAGATAAVRKNFGGALDTFKAQLRNIGADFTKAFIDPVQGGAAVDALNNISDALSVLRKALQPIIGPVMQRLADILRQVTARVRDFAAQFGPAAKGFKTFVDGTTTASRALEGLFENIKGFLPLLAFFGAKFGGTFLTQIPVVGQFLAGLHPVVLAIGALIAVTPELRTAFADVARELAPIVQNLIPAFSELLTAIAAALGPVVSAIAGALAPALTAIATALSSLVPRLIPLVNAIGELLIKLTPLIDLISQGLVVAFNLLVPVVEKAITVLTNLVNVVNSIDFAALGQKILASFVPALAGIQPILEKLLAAFNNLSLDNIIAQVEALASRFTALQPILITITALTAAGTAAFLVYRGALAAAAAAEAIKAVGSKALAVAQLFLVGSTHTLTDALTALNIVTGITISPFVAIAAIIAAVAAAFVVLYLKVQPVRDAVDGLIDRVQALLPSMDQVKAALSGLITVLNVIGAVLIGTVVVAFRLIVPVIQAVANLIGSYLKTAIQGILPIFDGLMAIVRALLPIFNLFRENLFLLVPIIAPIVAALLPFVAAIGALVIVLKLLPPIINIISAILNGVLKAAIDLIVDALNGLADIIEFVIGSLNRILDVFRFLIGIAVQVAQAFFKFNPMILLFRQIANAVGNLAESFGPVRAIVDGVSSAFEAAGRVIDGILKKFTKVRGFLNKLTLGKLFKDTGEGADEASKKTERTTQELTKLAAAAAAAVPPVRTLSQVQRELATASDALRTSLEGASQRIDPLLSAAEGVKNAQNAIKDAQQGAADASKRVAELDKERQKVLRDTIKPAREIELAERALQRARFDLAKTDREIIQTQKELNDFRAFGRAEQEAALERDLERAKIAANQARRSEQELLAEINKEKEKGNDESAVEINLAGLTLEQARAKLAAARATLAAQKQGRDTSKDETDNAKTAEEIEEDKRSARLDVLDAEQRQRDAERAHAGFRQEADIKEAELQQGLIDLQTQKIEQQDSINERQNHLNDLRNGETTLAKELKRLDEQIADAKRAQAQAAQRVTDAIKAAKDAEIALNIESAKFTGNLQRQAELERQRYLDRAAGLKLEPAVRQELEKTLGSVQNEINKVKELNLEYERRKANASAALSLQQQGLGGGTGDTNTLLLAQSIQQLAEAIGSEAAVKQASTLAKVTGKPVAFVQAEGGVVHNTSSSISNYMNKPAQHVSSMSGLINRPVHAIMGEGYKHELVLPLTKPNRIWQLVSQHLPKYPGAKAAVAKGMGMSPGPVGVAAPLIIPGPGYSRSGATPFIRKGEGPMTQDQADKMIKLLETLNENGGPSIHIDAPISTSQTYNEEMLAREIEKQVRKIIGRIR